MRNVCERSSVCISVFNSIHFFGPAVGRYYMLLFRLKHRKPNINPEYRYSLNAPFYYISMRKRCNITSSTTEIQFVQKLTHTRAHSYSMKTRTGYARMLTRTCSKKFAEHSFGHTRTHILVRFCTQTLALRLLTIIIPRNYCNSSTKKLYINKAINK